MNIKILDSWLKEYLKTDASPKELAKALSASSVSVERIEKFGNDFVYDIEVTTNRPDLMSIIGIAQEAAAVLPQSGINATFTPLDLKKPTIQKKEAEITIKNDPKLVNRVCAAILEVKVGKSPEYMRKRLESADIRSLNNLIDITNYVMVEMGHPAHVFDYDRLLTKTLSIRQSKPGEKITTLDGKTHTLPGGDILADDGKGTIVDLPGIMGVENSVVTDDTQRIVLFINNDNPHLIRKTSMSLGIRTEAAILNEKRVDPELAYKALLRGIELYQQIADATVIADIIDIYPHPIEPQSVTVELSKIQQVIGVPIEKKTVESILKDLGFRVASTAEHITVTPPSSRAHDITIEEDVIEEVARVYGYYKLPSILPPTTSIQPYQLDTNEFYWEERAKNALKYWGFTEVYTYSMVSEELLEVAPEEAVTIQNPLNEDMVYMRTTLIPSLLQAVKENKNRQTLSLFEIAKVYLKQENNLPKEILHLAGVIKKDNVSFYEVKGIIEQLFSDLGIKTYSFAKKASGGEGADVYLQKDRIGTIEILEENLIDFELDFEMIKREATLKKTYTPLSKYPPIIEDVSLIADASITYAEIVNLIKKQSELIQNVELIDTYENKKTFRITYQSKDRNLTNADITQIRESIYNHLKKDINAQIA